MHQQHKFWRSAYVMTGGFGLCQYGWSTRQTEQ
jgi:hypothetical protein